MSDDPQGKDESKDGTQTSLAGPALFAVVALAILIFFVWLL